MPKPGGKKKGEKRKILTSRGLERKRSEQDVQPIPCATKKEKTRWKRVHETKPLNRGGDPKRRASGGGGSFKKKKKVKGRGGTVKTKRICRQIDGEGKKNDGKPEND